MFSRRIFFQGYPAAVPRLVIAIIVDPINREAGTWFWSHIGEKILEAVPANTYSNPAPAVPLPAFKLGIATAHDHGTPTMIFRCRFPSHCMTVTNLIGTSVKFLHQASTASRRFVAQLRASRHKKHPAVAETQPKYLRSFPVSDSGRPLSGEPAEAFGG